MAANNKSFFRQVADDILDRETAERIAEQKAGLALDPNWAEGYYHLAQLYRVQQKTREAKEQLIIALEKKPLFADAHIALGEILISDGDLQAARQHAEIAAQLGNSRLLVQMERYKTG